MPRDYERDMETFERKYEAWRESEYEKYCEKQYDLLRALANIQQQVQPDGAEVKMRGEEIKGNRIHDAGAYARCSYCGRYSDKPGSLRGYVKCDCGKEGGWCGSFKKPDEKSEWSNA